MKSLSGFAIAAAAILVACGGESGAGSGEKSSSIPRERADALSSDGSRIAYEEYSTENDDACDSLETGYCLSYSRVLRMAYSDGTDAGLVPGGDGGETPAWSPDNAQIAFRRAAEVGWNPDIYVADLATGTVRNLTNDPWLTNGHWSPTWSPDGGKIAYGRLVPGGSVCGSSGCTGIGIYVMNIADGIARLVTSSALTFFGRIAWSPDGSTFAFECNTDGTYGVCTIKVDGTGLTQLTGSDGSAPVWSPDSKQIAFTTWRYGTGSEIAVMDSNGANDVSRLGSTGVTGHDPTWSPDGGRIAFVDVDASCPSSYGIYTVQTDGTGRTLILSNCPSSDSVVDSGVSAPAWTRSSTAPPPAPADQPPVASFTSSCDGLACQFDSSGSTDDVGIVSRAWAFGDGATAGDVVQPSHTYAEAGTYQVTLTIIDTAGQSGTATETVTVTARVDQPPVASFTPSCSGLTCTFDSSGSTDDHGITSRAWTFGDGTTATTVDVMISHTYAARGSYVVTLTVTDTAEQSATATQNITVPAKKQTK